MFDHNELDPFKAVGCAFGLWILTILTISSGFLAVAFILISKLIEKM